MRDLHINITGPRDRARQNVAFHVAQDNSRRGIDAQQVAQLIAELRIALAQSQLPPDDARRVERHLTTIEEESRSERPLLNQINDSMSFLSRLVESASGLAPLFSSTFQLLAAAVSGS